MRKWPDGVTDYLKIIHRDTIFGTPLGYINPSKGLSSRVTQYPHLVMKKKKKNLYCLRIVSNKGFFFLFFEERDEISAIPFKEIKERGENMAAD